MMTSTPDTLSIGDSVLALRVDNLSRTQIVRYLGASGDFNPIHHDDGAAKQGGHEGVIAPGMLVAGITSAALTEWVSVREVERFRTRFVDTVRPGDSLTVHGKVTAIEQCDDPATAEINLTVKNGDEDVVLEGDATVRI